MPKKIEPLTPVELNRKIEKLKQEIGRAHV